MTNNIRFFLWLALALTVWMNYQQWQIDYGPKTSASMATDGTGAPKPPALGETVPQVEQPAANPSAATSVPAVTAPGAAAGTTSTPATPAESTAQKVHVVTDVLVVDISLKGGDLVRAELPTYPLVKGKPDPVVLLNTDSPATNYVLRTGLSSPNPAASPTHLATLTAAATKYELAPGQDELRVPLTWTDGNGVTVTKVYTFKRGFYGIGLEYDIQNNSGAPWTARSYAQINRTDPPVERSMFKVESFAYRTPAIWGPTYKYKKFDIHKKDTQTFSGSVQGGWIAGMQHHFVSAVVPNPSDAYDFTLASQGNEYLLTAAGQPHTVAPGASLKLTENLFVGPKLQKQLVTLNPELDRVADYSWATVIARPLFWLLQKAHSLVMNWGLAIILVTFLLKLLFYPLAQYSGRQMARMRQLAPRMKQLQETYKDDREKLGRSMMELYKTEKANPLSGCLPMLIQMPVFLAFYWVLLESVEMRQAPFLGWINDLSSRDPFFILPALNGLAMWIQYKLNPPPPDPMQAKVFQFMPLVFSVMFALFPAGLVLYWVTNTGLSILQQWNINRTIAAEDKLRKR
ncbi:MAG TPA: membrane protein insertase YidC [Steroidobacteraceae bacterium]|nr:membrane protein insertase YidC [Steroidobacteraceae bacterium]